MNRRQRVRTVKTNPENRNNFKYVRENRGLSIGKLATITGSDKIKLHSLDNQRVKIKSFNNGELYKLTEALNCRTIELYYPIEDFEIDDKGRLIVDELFWETYPNGYIWARIKNNYFRIRMCISKNKPIIDRMSLRKEMHL